MRHFCFVQFIRLRCDFALAITASLGFVLLGKHLGFACRPLAGCAALATSLDAVEQVLAHGRLGIVACFVYAAFLFHAGPNRERRPGPLDRADDLACSCASMVRRLPSGMSGFVADSGRSGSGSGPGAGSLSCS